MTIDSNAMQCKILRPKPGSSRIPELIKAVAKSPKALPYNTISPESSAWSPYQACSATSSYHFS